MADRPEPLDDDGAQKRANWVGLRTLRQRPRLVDHLEDGEPVFEVDSIRLVLRRADIHFHRVLPCSMCGQDTLGERVTRQSDLAQEASPVLCQVCVRADIPLARPAAREWPPPMAPPVFLAATVPDPPEGESWSDIVFSPSAPPVDYGRLAIVEAEVSALRAQVAQLVAAHAAEVVERRRSDHETRVGLQRAVELRLAALRADIAAAGDRVIVLEDGAREALAQARVDAEGIAASVGRELAGLTQAVQDLASGRDDVAVRLHALEQRPIGDEHGMAARLDALDARVQAAVKRLTRVLGAQGSMPSPAATAVRGQEPMAPAPAPAEARDLLAFLEQQLMEADHRLARRDIDSP